MIDFCVRYANILTGLAKTAGSNSARKGINMITVLLVAGVAFFVIGFLCLTCGADDWTQPVGFAALLAGIGLCVIVGLVLQFGVRQQNSTKPPTVVQTN